MKSIIQYLSEIIYLLGKDSRKLPMMISLFLLVSLLDLAGLGLIAPYVALVVNPESITNVEFLNILKFLSLPTEKEPLLLFIGFGLLTVFLFKLISVILINRLILKFSQQQQIRLRSELMQSYQKMPYTDYLQRNSSDYIHSVQILTGQFANGIVLLGLRALSDGIVSFVILVMLALTNSTALGVLVLLIGGLIYSYDRLFRKHVKSYGKKANKAATSMVQGINEGIEGLKEIRILGKELHFYKMVREGAIEYGSNFVKAQIISSTPRYLLEFIMISFVVLLVVSTLLLGENLLLLVPTLAMFGVAALRLLPSANSLSAFLIQLRYNRDSVSRLYDDLHRINETTNRANCNVPTLNNNTSFEELDLQSIQYSYPESKHPELDGVSLKLKVGESIGLIGPSGSGKTTLVDVILGLLEPQKGRLLYNGNELKESITAWRNQVAYIPQQVFLIDDSLRNNVALGVDENEIDDLQLHKALRQAQLTELVKGLTDGDRTLLGEHGVRLSGGQRQRVALARAFYHERDVLVLDEATSALDNETESEIVNEIQRLKGDKTMIVIAHRLTTVQHCDRIYCLERGKIIDSGSPEQILKFKNYS